MIASNRYGTDKRIQYGIYALVLAGIIAAAWFGYSYYKKGQEQAAYKELAESIEGYVKAQGEVSPHWIDIEKAFEAGAVRHSSSRLHPYFLAYQADALVQQGKLKEAVVLMDKAVGEIDRAQPLYYAYAVKRALLKIDINDTTLAQQGRNELNELALNAANPIKELAGHYKSLTESSAR